MSKFSKDREEDEEFSDGSDPEELNEAKAAVFAGPTLAVRSNSYQQLASNKYEFSIVVSAL